MDVIEATYQQRLVRGYTDETVEKEIICSLLDAANRTLVLPINLGHPSAVPTPLPMEPPQMIAWR